MNIVAAAKNDFFTLYDLWQIAGLRLYPVDDEQNRYQAMLVLHPELMLVLKDEAGSIIGSILGAFDGRTASIHRFAIHPDHQKKGLGKLLMLALEEKIRAKGIKKLVAQVHVKNTQVVGFYEKQGFKEMDYLVSYFKDL